MVYRNFFKLFWKYFDVVSFVLAVGFGVYGAFLFGFRCGILAIAVGFLILGFLSELITSSKGGD